MDKVYFDWASTAKPNYQENEKALHIAQDHFFNPSSKHKAGIETKKLLETARQSIAKNLLVQPNQIFFTSGGTESNHIALLSNLTKPSFTNHNIIVSEIEHSAISEQVKMLEKIGLEVRRVKPNNEGFILPEAVLNVVDENTSFVSIMAVNNETGAIQPVSEIAKALQSQTKRKPHFHTDAVQAIGKVDVDFSNVDSFSLSGHKLGAMRGIGLLYLKQNLKVFNQGGHQENGIRPGTENLAGILSLQYALEKFTNNHDSLFQNAIDNFKSFFEELKLLKSFTIIPKVREVFDKRFSPFVVQLAHSSIPGEVMVRALSDLGVFVSTGSACSSSRLERPILKAMGLDKGIQQRAFRISFGYTTTKEEIVFCLNALERVSKTF